MNYRIYLSPDFTGIRKTYAAADPGTDVYGTLQIARVHLANRLDVQIDRLRDVRKEWLRKPEKQLAVDEPKLTEAA